MNDIKKYSLKELDNLYSQLDCIPNKSGKEYTSLRRKLWRLKNLDKCRSQNRKSYFRNHGKNITRNKKYNKKNKKNILSWQKDYQNSRYAIDIQFRLSKILRNRLYQALKAQRLTPSKTLPISYSKIIEKLSNSPKNLKDYEVDHIQPLCSFDLSNYDEIQKAMDPENLQWIKKTDHYIKTRRDIKKSIHHKL